MGGSGLGDRVDYLEAILDHCADGIWTTDREGRIVEWGAGVERLLGLTAERVRGEPIEELFSDPVGLRRHVRRVLGGEILTGLEVDVRVEGAAAIPLEVSMAPLAEHGVVGVARDNRRNLEVRRELLRRSITDRLTGLYNQTHFYEVLETEKERADLLDHDLSLVLIDLDGFKEINDRLGHLEGDRVLRRVASILFELIRKEVDSAFRYGGDEFVILCPGFDEERAVRFAERIRHRVEQDDLAGVRTSIGVCEYRDHDRTIQLVKEADQAMYRAKRSGGDCVSAAGGGDR